MVRFIALSGFKEYTNEVPIYIPIWLDLLRDAKIELLNSRKDLHSNMVRFIAFI